MHPESGMSSAKEEEDEKDEEDEEEDEEEEEVRSEKLHFLLKSCRRLTAAPASAAGEENWPRQFNFTLNLNFQHRHTSAHLTESGQRDGLAVAPVRVLLRHLQPRPRLLRPSSE